MPEHAAPNKIGVSEIGEFVRFESCERRLKLAYNDRAIGKDLPHSERLFNTLDPILQQMGAESEAFWEKNLQEEGFYTIPQGEEGLNLKQVLSAFSGIDPGTNAYAREVTLEWTFGSFRTTGRADFITLMWNEGTPIIRIVEGKASRKDRTYHRIQLATYILITRNLINEETYNINGHEIDPDFIEGTVVRIDKDTNAYQNIVSTPPLNLDTEISDVERLFSSTGLLERVSQAPLDSLSFQISTKCDGCVFSVHCLPESARQRRLELLGITPSVVRALNRREIKTLDALAGIDLQSDLASSVVADEDFDENLTQLQAKAKARLSTLPDKEAPELKGYTVETLPNQGLSQLPLHTMGENRLIRVYLSVHYDYSENRLGAISAHISSSDFEISTPFETTQESQYRPAAKIEEKSESSTRDIQNASSKDIAFVQTSKWTRSLEEDTASERALLEQFFQELLESITEIAQSSHAPVHFYVYTRSEMTQLIEACSRCGSRLLGHLRELLGCREPTEQLIFSVLQSEISNRFALGWTGQSLSVASSLRWFGNTFHWTRTVAGKRVELDKVFEQDIFDFKSTLHLDSNNEWAAPGDEGAQRFRFEIRSRFNDTLSVPYWHAFWGTLPKPTEVKDAKVSASIKRYMRVKETPGLFKAYLKARGHALRWLEERIKYKNPEIEKTPLNLSRLHQFQLGIHDTSAAAIDFLQLDHHVAVTDWLAIHTQPPSRRIQGGRTIPVRDAKRNSDEITAVLDVCALGLTNEDFHRRSSLDTGSFVRLNPRNEDLNAPQTIKQLWKAGITGIVKNIDWQAGTISLEPIFSRETNYCLPSWDPEAGNEIFSYATIDESPSDYVASKVESRLKDSKGAHVFPWFDPTCPELPSASPIPNSKEKKLEDCLDCWVLPNGHGLKDDQKTAVLNSTATTVHLLKGPPGTGKTVTTASSILAHAAVRLEKGAVILVGANTHLAVDTLLSRLQEYSASFAGAAESVGLKVKDLTFSRVHSKDVPDELKGLTDVVHIKADAPTRAIQKMCKGGIAVIGGTTSALLKMCAKHSKSSSFKSTPTGFLADLLVVDEASMMVFPHFLALASLVNEKAQILLSGDNRQLPPIVANDWESEDRPPTQLYQPYVSAYDAVLRLVEESEVDSRQCTQSPLTFTFRLPPVIRDLISRVYSLDQIQLEGPDETTQTPNGHSQEDNPLTKIWSNTAGLILLVHEENASRKSNSFEASLIKEFLSVPQELPDGSVAVITPHRAQRALLKEELKAFEQCTNVIDTVERLQGGERPIIIVSGTESDPAAIGASASFILNLNRANVAFSRTQERLIVVCAQSLLDHIPSELDDYESAMLWKSLRSACKHLIFESSMDDIKIRGYSPVSY